MPCCICFVQARTLYFRLKVKLGFILDNVTIFWRVIMSQVAGFCKGFLCFVAGCENVHDQ